MNISLNSQVRHKNNPGRVGILTGNNRVRNGRNYLQVKYHDGSIDYVHENELEPEDHKDINDPYSLLKNKSFGRSLDLRQNLTFVNLSGKLANNVYSLGITGTDFWAHQYKPLLTLLESPANGILIADDVGLGKTIEAGLIWTEMRARFDMRRLLIVCPAMLREKWKDELQIRFGIRARILSPKELYEEAKVPRNQTLDGEAWITSYQSLRPSKKNKEPGERKSSKDIFNAFIEENAENESIFDLVIFDEAHYMRNDTSATSRLGGLIREVTDYIVLLSATPINLRNDDLFNLLKLTDPDHFRNNYDFEEMIKANIPLNRAKDLALNKIASADEILESLKDAKNQNLLSSSAQLKALLDEDISDHKLKDKEYRANLADSISRINLLGHVLTRTRKKEIYKEKPKRIIHREAIVMTENEKKLYFHVTDAIKSYATKHEMLEGFLYSTFQKQVTSCPAAAYKYWNQDSFDQLNDLENSTLENEDNNNEVKDKEISLKNFICLNLPRDLTFSILRNEDSKFSKLRTVLLNYFKEEPNDKVILFTTYRATARYLFERLTEIGINSLLLWGSMEKPKQEYINEFKSSSDLKVLISTEVASEGVDLQFSCFLINYDLPWNPMRIEQRIGRIDRLGQKSQKIHVWNMYYQESIDEKIVNRLFERVKIFEESLGEHEAIIGEKIARLESDLLTKNLSSEEENQRIEEVAQVIENIKQVEKNLEENAPNLISHGGFLLEKIQAAQDFNKRITEKDLMIYVQDYLNSYATGHIFRQSPDKGNLNIFDIKLPAKLAAEFDDFLRSKNLINQTTLANGELKSCEFINKVNVNNSAKIEYINQFHPLIRFISEKLRKVDSKFYPLIAIKVDTDLFSQGEYFFCIKKFNFEGIKSEEYLNYLAFNLKEKKFLTKDESERLVNIARIEGDDWLSSFTNFDDEEAEKILDDLEVSIDNEFDLLLKRKINENIDRVDFQIKSIEQYLARKLPNLEETYQKLLDANKVAGAKLRLGQINKLKEKTSVQIEKIKLKDNIDSSKLFVCSGLIKVN